MKTLFGATLVAVLVSCVAVPFVALGQQKTAKECRDEWRASTDPAKGKQKDYVAKCRGEGTAAAPGARPAVTAGKTAKECREEWRASTDAAKGTQKDYVAKCRGEGAAATPTAPTTAAPSAPATAAKTAKACRDEWRASTDPNKGTQKDYVAKCRGEAAAGAPTAPGAGAPAATPPAAAAKTVRACRDEWRASKDPAKGTEKDYVAKCRAGPTAAAPAAPATPPAAPAHTPSTTAAPPPAQTPSTTAAPAPATPPPSTAAPAPAPSAAAPARPAPAAPAPAPAAPAPTGADQFQNEAQAKAHCPTDLVVWVNLNSHIYHFSGNANYGRHFVDKGGAYMCEKDALRETFRAAENEKRP